MTIAMASNPFWRYGCDPSIPMLIPIGGISTAIINGKSVLIHASDQRSDAYKDNPSFKYAGEGILAIVGGKPVETDNQVCHFWQRVEVQS